MCVCVGMNFLALGFGSVDLSVNVYGEVWKSLQLFSLVSQFPVNFNRVTGK